ncbi:Aste57867_8822 [Aphanomyces stellatus]|uniref:Aste57867_8822 protein n=1 Tax=Aphanomyces stellatus TaxID=120398 RepID=A0A485KLN3_9STRA|nr:hypothetical protein As57867_008787 [Aphanomyces stellatus]VFT85708.1 Aste57867_8822 [Aphanomyces stellatus]
MKTLFSSSLALLALAATAFGHGRMVKPPHRGHIGRVPGFEFIPIDYDDNGLSAGGIEKTKDGFHGICGDPYTDASPRSHENGGKWGLFRNVTGRAVGQCFSPGATVPITIQITANHWGNFDFGVCKLNKPTDVETEACFQPLAQPNGQPLWKVPAGNLFFDMEYVLPKDLKCDGDAHCVLRWHYRGGNNFGANAAQEEFWNCADIYISDNCGAAPPATTPGTTANPQTPSPTTASPATPAPPTTSSLPPATTPAPVVTPSPPPGDKCDGNRNTCYWPENRQVIPYAQADCLSFPSFVWCP